MPGQEASGDILSLAASTMRLHKTELVDNIMADQVILAMLGMKDLYPALTKSRQPEGGKFAEGIELEDSPGEKIKFPLMYVKNSTTGWFDGHDLLDITPQDEFTSALYDWRRLAGSVNVSNHDLDRNRGKNAIFKLLEAKIGNLKLALADDLGDAILGDRASGSKEPFGLLDIIKDDPTTNPSGGNIGGISAVTDTWWRNYAADFASGTFGTDQTGLGMAAVRKLIRRTTFGSKKASVLLAGESAFERIENTMINQARYNDPSSTKALASAGFEALTVKGIPVTMEKKIETVRTASALTGDAVYALNLNYLKIFGMSDRWFEPSKMKEPTDQDAMIMHVITGLQFATNARRQQGVLFGISAV